MMIQEFEKLTGIEVTPEEYSEIETMYYDHNGDKKEFCKWFKKENKLVEVLRQLNDEKEKKLKQTALDLSCAQASVRSLKEALEKEQEWKPFEDEHNVKQADYEQLKNDLSTKVLTEGEAIDMIAEEFGFDKSKVRILREVAKEEINRHRQCRKSGTSYQREPLFNAWDWNYIRFDVCGIAYEMHNGQLCLFWH